MKLTILKAGLTSVIALSAAAANAEGTLNIYNWGNYTNPEMIEKFEKQYDIEVTLDGYDSNETMLAKVKEGGSGYDIVVPGDYMVAIMVGEGLLAEINASEMENFKNLDPN
ncbi:MAG: putrescine/spermidine ABC transporter substrate-binding protein, partial [Phaeobacter gallaeciensis]